MTQPAEGSETEWRTLNRANWDERLPIHLGAREAYDLTPLRHGHARLDGLVTETLGDIAGKRVLHLQCHFGRDSLTLAQQGAQVVGLDFSTPAIAAARALASELGLSERAQFVEADVYGALEALQDVKPFDRILVSWGALCWLPDMVAWAQVVAGLLRPRGWLALTEAHPAAYVFDDATATPDGRPGWYAPYLGRAPLLEDKAEDYADPTARLANSRTVEWLHPLGDVIGGLVEAGLRLDRFIEHDAIAWQMFESLVRGPDGFWRWPDRPWLPLSYSLRATKP